MGAAQLRRASGAQNTILLGKEFPLGSPPFASFVLSDIDLAGFNSGAAAPKLNRNDVHEPPLALPSKELIEQFELNAQPMFELARPLDWRNADLRVRCDLLFPKPVPGEIDVSAAENAMEAAK